MLEVNSEGNKQNRKTNKKYLIKSSWQQNSQSREETVNVYVIYHTNTANTGADSESEKSTLLCMLILFIWVIYIWVQ